jgi:hypothetical protein
MTPAVCFRDLRKTGFGHGDIPQQIIPTHDRPDSYGPGMFTPRKYRQWGAKYDEDFLDSASVIGSSN